MPLSPQQRSMRARIAAHSRWAHEDGKPNAARATAGFRRRFEDEVDPEGCCPKTSADGELTMR